jgi:hypothetical protein
MEESLFYGGLHGKHRCHDAWSSPTFMAEGSTTRGGARPTRSMCQQVDSIGGMGWKPEGMMTY